MKRTRGFAFWTVTCVVLACGVCWGEGSGVTGASTASGTSLAGLAASEGGQEMLLGAIGIDLYPTYRGSYFWKEGTDQAGIKMGWLEHRLGFAVPLWRQSDSDLALYTRLKWLDFQGSRPMFPKTGDRFPNDLYDLSVGALWRQSLSGDSMVIARLEAGSPSDRPFSSWEEVAIKADAAYITPWTQDLSWIFGVSYSNIREIKWPVPVVGLVWRPHDKLTVAGGFPFAMLNWQPYDRWELTGYYVAPREVHAKVSYAAMDSVKLYGEFNYADQRFFRHDRKDDGDILSYYDKEAKLGVTWQVTQNVFVDAAGGYAFGRFWFEEDTYDEKGDSKIDMDDGLFAMLRLGIKF